MLVPALSVAELADSTVGTRIDVRLKPLGEFEPEESEGTLLLDLDSRSRSPLPPLFHFSSVLEIGLSRTTPTASAFNENGKILV